MLRGRIVTYIGMRRGFTLVVAFLTFATVHGATRTIKRQCTKDGIECVFPFMFADRLRFECLPSSGRTWCGIKSEVTVNEEKVDWDYCDNDCTVTYKSDCTTEGVKCALPWVDEYGHNHTTCPYATPAWKRNYFWCPLTQDFKSGDYEWGYCADRCPSESTTTQQLDTTSTRASTAATSTTGESTAFKNSLTSASSAVDEFNRKWTVTETLVELPTTETPVFFEISRRKPSTTAKAEVAQSPRAVFDRSQTSQAAENSEDIPGGATPEGVIIVTTTEAEASVLMVVGAGVVSVLVIVGFVALYCVCTRRGLAPPSDEKNPENGVAFIQGATKQAPVTKERGKYCENGKDTQELQTLKPPENQTV